MSEKKPNMKDMRTGQILKLYPDGLKSERVHPFIPKKVENVLMDIVSKGNVIGDCEIGSDGFIEIMFTFKASGGITRIAKLKRLPEDNNMTFEVW